MLTVEDIKNAISGTDFEVYGLRVDSGIRYSVGDTASNSHQLYQDPLFDMDDELVYPLIEDGIYKGFYDAGELDGSCAIGFDANNDASIGRAIEMVKIYLGDCIHVLGGNYAQRGEDAGELIIRNAEVLGSYDK